MDHRHIDIETLVRRVLDELGTADRPASTQSEAVRIDDPVISIEQLSGKLGGTRRILVSSTAVITPAARDLMRQQKVSVQRSVLSASRSNVTGQLVLATAETQFDPSPLIQILGRHGMRTDVVAKDCLASLFDDLADQVARTGQLSVVLTGKSAAALCLANRHRALRAASGTDITSVRSAIDTIGANVLVVDRTGRTTMQVAHTILAFYSTGARECPQQYQSQLT